MNSTKRISAVKVTLFALIFVSMCSRSLSTKCERYSWNNYCRLEAISITTDDEATNFEFPNETEIAFYKSKILSPAKILFGRLPDYVKTVRIDESNVPKVYINQTIDKFYAFDSSVQEVIIDRTSTYKLRQLSIIRNSLRSLPENISRLTNLVELYLSANKIETVSMDHFKDLTNLKILHLSGNSIVRVDTASPLNLPMLEKLYLHVNKIQYLSITFWNFPNLQTFDVERNKLRRIMNFPRRFPKLVQVDTRANQWSCAWLEVIKSKMSKMGKSSESCSGKSVDKICCQDYTIDENSFNSFEERMTFEILQMSENLQEAIQQISEKFSKQTTDTRVLTDTKIGDVRNEVLEELKKVNAKVDENRALIVDDQKMFQKGIDQISANFSKQTTEMQEKVKSIESNIRQEVLQALEKINERVLENQVSIGADRKQFQQTSEKLKKGINTIGERVSNLTTDIKMQIDNKMSDVSRTIQGMEEKIKSSIMKQVEELQKTNADDRKQFQQEIDTIGERISKTTTDIRELIYSQISNMTETVKEIKVKQNQDIQKISIRVDENRASIVDDRKHLEEKFNKQVEELQTVDVKFTDDQKRLEEKINNADKQNKEEFKWVKQKLNENRALIDDVVDDLYLAELEKQDL